MENKILKELIEIKELLRIIASNTEQKEINFELLEKSVDSISSPRDSDRVNIS